MFCYRNCIDFIKRVLLVQTSLHFPFKLRHFLWFRRNNMWLKIQLKHFLPALNADLSYRCLRWRLYYVLGGTSYNVNKSRDILVREEFCPYFYNTVYTSSFRSTQKDWNTRRTQEVGCNFVKSGSTHLYWSGLSDTNYWVGVETLKHSERRPRFKSKRDITHVV